MSPSRCFTYNINKKKVLPKNKGIIMVHDIFVPVWGELDKDDSNRLGYYT